MKSRQRVREAVQADEDRMAAEQAARKGVTAS